MRRARENETSMKTRQTVVSLLSQVDFEISCEPKARLWALDIDLHRFEICGQAWAASSEDVLCLDAAVTAAVRLYAVEQRCVFVLFFVKGRSNERAID